MVSRLFQAFAGATIHYYRADQIDAVWAWVKDGWLESLVALSTKEHRA